MSVGVGFCEGWCGVGVVESEFECKLVFEECVFLRCVGGEEWCFEVKCE